MHTVHSGAWDFVSYHGFRATMASLGLILKAQDWHLRPCQRSLASCACHPESGFGAPLLATCAGGHLFRSLVVIQYRARHVVANVVAYERCRYRGAAGQQL